MQPYRFALQNDGKQIEELGSMAMPDDRDAVAFAELIARDLANGSQRGWAVAIVKGTRTVRSIPVE
jgi:hypothetical protein